MSESDLLFVEIIEMDFVEVIEIEDVVQVSTQSSDDDVVIVEDAMDDVDSVSDDNIDLESRSEDLHSVCSFESSSDEHFTDEDEEYARITAFKDSHLSRGSDSESEAEETFTNLNLYYI
ncbi:hypothetical protein MSG28_003639 [Choristoneura fumiferana]|uniref:Uncharacterized protein n=1 Tax=Choristoneura fumiferana TaxID=7141 RepID=A0ACC0KG24_CHOFU|nr:hypothetical protein MSG28_003639 [Choristoneura fumiferana]